MWHISGKSCLKWSTVWSLGLRVASVKVSGWWWYSCHCFDRAKCAGMWLGQKLPWLYCWNARIPMVATAQYVELFLVGCRFCRASIQNNGMPWHLKGDSSIDWRTGVMGDSTDLNFPSVLQTFVEARGSMYRRHQVLTVAGVAFCNLASQPGDDRPRHGDFISLGKTHETWPKPWGPPGDSVKSRKTNNLQRRLSPTCETCGSTVAARLGLSVAW